MNFWSNESHRALKTDLFSPLICPKKEEARGLNIPFTPEEKTLYCSVTILGHCGYRSHKLSGGREEGGGSLFMTAG